MVFRLAAQVSLLLEDMVALIVRERHLPLDEVRSWTWTRLLAVYRQIGKQHWDQSASTIQATEIGVARALQAAFGKSSPNPLPEYDEVKQADPFEPLKKKQDETPAWLKKFQAANKTRDYRPDDQE